MQQAKKEYWKLVRKLNSGNKTKNFKTEIKFSVVKNSTGLLDLIASTTESRHVLCSEHRHNRWTVSRFTEYLELAEVCLKIANLDMSKGYNRLNVQILTALFKTID